MEFIIELLGEALFEGIGWFLDSKKCPKIIKYFFMMILAGIFVGLFLLIGYSFYQNNNLLGLGFYLCLCIGLLAFVYFHRKK